MDINISGKVGKGVNSSPTDIAKIQNLLAEVGVYKLPNAPAAMPVTAKTPVKCPDDVVEAITSFQKFWGSSDGVVDPGGISYFARQYSISPLLDIKVFSAGLSR